MFYLICGQQVRGTAGSGSLSHCHGILCRLNYWRIRITSREDPKNHDNVMQGAQRSALQFSCFLNDQCSLWLLLPTFRCLLQAEFCCIPCWRFRNVPIRNRTQNMGEPLVIILIDTRTKYDFCFCCSCLNTPPHLTQVPTSKRCSRISYLYSTPNLVTCSYQGGAAPSSYSYQPPDRNVEQRTNLHRGGLENRRFPPPRHPPEIGLLTPSVRAHTCYRIVAASPPPCLILASVLHSLPDPPLK